CAARTGFARVRVDAALVRRSLAIGRHLLRIVDRVHVARRAAVVGAVRVTAGRVAAAGADQWPGIGRHLLRIVDRVHVARRPAVGIARAIRLVTLTLTLSLALTVLTLALALVRVAALSIGRRPVGLAVARIARTTLGSTESSLQGVAAALQLAGGALAGVGRG